ncbi:MAG: UDP-3-O-(3-hydroxymyristoyl)glucosamine N-acyltransferase [Alphaproteobacteria bacterium]
MLDPRFYKPLGPVPLGELIDGLAVDVEPKFLDEVIEGVATLSDSRRNEISFLQSKKYIEGLETAKATACFVPENLASLAGAARIIPLVSNFPRTHFGRVTARLVSEKTLFTDGEMDSTDFVNPKIHPTVVIAATALIAPDVEIGPYSVIGPGVEIGAGSKIGSHVTIHFTVIGKNCFVKPHASIGSRGFGVDGDEKGVFDLPHIGRVIMGDRVSVGCHTSIDRGLIGDTVINDDVKIDNLVQIAHNVTLGVGTMLAGHVGLSGSCNVGAGVLMGGSAGLADHINVGDGARVAAYAGVMKDIPAGETWSGIPAMPIRDHMRTISATKKLIQKQK